MAKKKVLETAIEQSINDAISEESVSIESGQTSDHSPDISELPADYKWDENPKSIDEFFTYNDYLFLIAEGERQFKEYSELSEEYRKNRSSYGSRFYKVYKGHSFSLWFQFKELFEDVFFDEPHLSISCYFAVSNEIFDKYKFISDMKNASFEKFRNDLMNACRLYDFSDLSRVPEGVSDLFVLKCEDIDKKKAEIEDNFVLIALYLSDLDKMGDVNFTSYGCKNIYDFAEARFGFGRTTTKNFIAICNKFIECSVIREPYQDYSYSQLTELVPVDEKLLPEFSPKMTIKEIRKKKKELLGTVEKVGEDDRSVKCKNDDVTEINVEALRAVLNNWRCSFDAESSDNTAFFVENLFDLLEEKFGIDFRC